MSTPNAHALTSGEDGTILQVVRSVEVVDRCVGHGEAKTPSDRPPCMRQQ